MPQLEAGAQAPEFTLPDQDDNPVSLEDFRGRQGARLLLSRGRYPGLHP